MTPNAPSKKAVLFIFITMLIDTIGFGLILPVMPALIVDLTGEGLSAASIYGGWLWFAYAVMQFFFAPVLGNLSDRFGRRPVILFSLFALGLDYVVMGFAPTLGWLFAGRIVSGIAGATFSPATAYLADISPPEKRAQNFGLLGAAFGVGFILGPAIGGLLGTLGPRAPFFAAALLALVNVAFGFFVLPESLAPANRRTFNLKRSNPLGTLLQMRKYPAVYGLAAALLLFQIGHQVLPSTWSFYTTIKFQWSSAAIGASLAAVGVIIAISQGVLSRILIPRLKEWRTAVLALIATLLCYLGYAFVTQGWMVYVCMSMWFFAALAFPAINALMSQQVPADAQGELQGGVASLYSLSAIVGPPVMTQLLGYFSSDTAPVYFPGAAFVCAAVLTGVSIILFIRATSAHRAE